MTSSGNGWGKWWFRRPIFLKCHWSYIKRLVYKFTLRNSLPLLCMFKIIWPPLLIISHHSRVCRIKGIFCWVPPHISSFRAEQREAAHVQWKIWQPHSIHTLKKSPPWVLESPPCVTPSPAETVNHWAASSDADQFSRLVPKGFLFPTINNSYWRKPAFVMWVVSS